MTTQELFVKCNDYKRSNRSLRNGQCMMNVLYDLDKELYDKVSGSDNDPFYVDDNIPKFLEFLNSEGIY